MLGSERWRHFGTDVQKLHNDRYRITRRFQVPSDEELYGSNAPTQTFQDFGALDGAKWGVSEADPKTGIAYTNARLIEQRTEFPTGLGYQILVYIYETITNEFVETAEPRKSVGQNGLGRLDIEQVGSPTASFTGVVGTTEKVVDGVTYYLAQVQEQVSNEAQVRLNTIWLEAGLLAFSEQFMNEGVKRATYNFFSQEGVVAGPIISKSEQDIEGIPTIQIVTLQTADGEALVKGPTTPVFSYERQVAFNYPGIIKLREDAITRSGTVIKLFNYDIDPPVTAQVTADVFIFFQEEDEFQSGDFTFDSADGYWNPDKWAKLYTSGIGHSFSPFVEIKGMRSYRVDTDVSGITEEDNSGTEILSSNGVIIINNKGAEFVETESNDDPSSGEIFARINGISDTQGIKFVVNSRRCFARSPFIMEARGGPVDPAGKRWVLETDLRPAFETVDGTRIYKKVLIVATV